MKIVRKILIIVGILILILGVVVLGIFLLVKFWFLQPTGEALSLPTLAHDAPVYNTTAVPMEELAQIQADYYRKSSSEIGGEGTGVGSDEKLRKPLCGDQEEMMILAVGIDYEGSGYLYGLADVIRIVRVDFTVPQVDVVALPRALLVRVPEDRIQVENPILLNQAYFFGTPGMGHYAGKGNGAGSLAETIQYNFGVSADYYVVVNFEGFVKFVDILGGIEVDLPAPVDDLPYSSFPAGKQILSGEQALDLARIRNKYSDFYRIDNQTIILHAIFSRLKEPAVWIRIPELITILKDSIIMDIPSNQIDNLVCIIQKLDKADLHFANPPEELVLLDWEYIPSMNQEMQIIRWNAAFTRWLYENIWYYNK
jgi:LCP family protein required for cell wall assembly